MVLKNSWLFIFLFWDKLTDAEFKPPNPYTFSIIKSQRKLIHYFFLLWHFIIIFCLSLKKCVTYAKLILQKT